MDALSEPHQHQCIRCGKVKLCVCATKRRVNFGCKACVEMALKRDKKAVKAILKRLKPKGFTLIELMIVVAIIGILAGIAIPQFANLVHKSQEGATKGNLGTLRSALAIYYGDTEGVYPVTMDALSAGQRYIQNIPLAYYPNHHTAGATWGAGNNAAFLASFTETADWWLFTDQPGLVIANCTHMDTKGRAWTTY